MQPGKTSAAALTERIDPDVMLRQVIAWSAINTGTGNLDGLDQQAAALADAFAVLPGEIELVTPSPTTAVGVDGIERGVEHARHLMLRVRPEIAQRVLLTGHMDTVYPAGDPFQTQHWIDRDTLNGPGVADMKGGLAVILAALSAFEGTAGSDHMGYDVMINSDEEAGSPSSAGLITQLARDKLAALTYEPSALPDGTLAGERGGSGNYSVTVRGRAAHAGRNPQDGRNALLAAAALALDLKALEVPGLAINPARIDGGSANNVVPDLAILRFNIRPQSSEIAALFDAGLIRLIARIAAEHDVALDCHGGITRPPKPIGSRALRLFELVRDCGAALGQTIRWQRSGGVCDGNNIAACGVPVVDTMGVRGGAIHSPDEFLIIPSLVERAALSALVLQRLASGEAL